MLALSHGGKMQFKYVTIALAGTAMLTGGCAAEGTPEPAVTVTVTETPSADSDSGQTAESSQAATGPWGDPLLLVDGRWRVGDNADIPPDGSLLTPFETYDCTWRVTDSAGAVVEEVTVTNPSGAVVPLQDGDLFESVGCTVWRFVDTSQPPSIDVPGEPKDVGDPILPGTYIVGESVPAGTYSQRDIDGPAGRCEYSIKRDNGIRISEIVSFESSNMGARSRTNEVLDLEVGDIFESTCGTWQRYLWEG